MLSQTENDQVFEGAVAFTRERSPASFDQWFSGVQFDGLTEGVLSLRARDEFVREWVDDHFLPTLTDFIRANTGWSVQVAWTVDSGLDRPMVDQPSAPPVRPRALSLRPSSIPPAPMPASNRDVNRDGARDVAADGGPLSSSAAPASPLTRRESGEIGRASCRERV